MNNEHNKHNEHTIVERLSALEHKRWSGWMRYLFEHGEILESGQFLMDGDSVRRWIRQMNTQYNELSEREKESDRIEARKTLQEIGRWMSEQARE